MTQDNQTYAQLTLDMLAYWKRSAAYWSNGGRKYGWNETRRGGWHTAMTAIKFEHRILARQIQRM